MTATLETTESLYVKSYGEVCSKAQAARILSVDTRTINRMIADGRLKDACIGRKVSVRSIARFVCEPKVVCAEAYAERMRKKYGTEYAV
jgi:hypothetical protein